MQQYLYKSPHPLAIRITCFLFCLTSGLVGAYFFYESQMLGFPDGFKDDLDHILVNLYPIYAIISISFALYFFYAGMDPHNKKLIINRKWAFSLFIFFVGIALGLVYYLPNFIEEGMNV